MLDTSTAYLLLVMTGFVLFAVLLVQHHNANEVIQKKRREVEDRVRLIDLKLDAMAQEMDNLKEQIEEVDHDLVEFEQ